MIPILEEPVLMFPNSAHCYDAFELLVSVRNFRAAVDVVGSREVAGLRPNRREFDETLRIVRTLHVPNEYALGYFELLVRADLILVRH